MVGFLLSSFIAKAINIIFSIGFETNKSFEFKIQFVKERRFTCFYALGTNLVLGFGSRTWHCKFIFLIFSSSRDHFFKVLETSNALS